MTNFESNREAQNAANLGTPKLPSFTEFGGNGIFGRIIRLLDGVFGNTALFRTYHNMRLLQALLRCHIDVTQVRNTGYGNFLVCMRSKSNSDVVPYSPFKSITGHSNSLMTPVKVKTEPTQGGAFGYDDNVVAEYGGDFYGENIGLEIVYEYNDDDDEVGTDIYEDARDYYKDFEYVTASVDMSVFDVNPTTVAMQLEGVGYIVANAEMIHADNDEVWMSLSLV